MIAKGAEGGLAVRPSRPFSQRTHRCSFVRLLAVTLTVSRSGSRAVALAATLAASLPRLHFLVLVVESDARLFFGDERDGGRGRRDARRGRRGRINRRVRSATSGASAHTCVVTKDCVSKDGTG